MLGAHKLRARRTVWKSVFFRDINCWQTNRGLFRLKEPWSRRFSTLPVGQKLLKTIVNICTRLRQRWINFSTQDIIWKNMTRRCPSKADFTAEASQQWPEKELKHGGQLQNQAWPLQTEKFKIAIVFKNSPQFFKISFTALYGLEHKIII